MMFYNQLNKKCWAVCSAPYYNQQVIWYLLLFKVSCLIVRVLNFLLYLRPYALQPIKSKKFERDALRNLTIDE